MEETCHSIEPPLPGSVEKGSAAAAATVTVYDDTRRLESRKPGSSPPHKTRRFDTGSVDKQRSEKGHSKRRRKGDAKRARKERALAQAEKCEYYHDDQGLRRVRPYIYDFQTHAKERWLGRKVIDVFSAEFGGNPRSYYEQAIRCGLLTVNGKSIDLDYVFKNNDVVCNRTHRHEPPVAGGDIPIVSESADEIVVDKPCTVPIHPCGSYRFNTLFYILQRQRPELSLRVCHRLDRLTSGLTIFAKTAERAGVIQKQIGAGKTRKTYLARVSGNFGQRLPPERRQAGSPSTFAESCSAPPTRASPSEAVARTDARGRTFLTPKTGEGNSSADRVIEDAGGTSSPSGSELAAIPKALNGPGELWWRYETPGERVVRGFQKEDGDDVRPNEKVNGAVPNTGDDANSAIAILSEDDGGAEEISIRVNCPIRVLDAKDGVYECHAEGKEAQTVIRKVAYDVSSDTSVLECTPVHGRTHQIRLHLQWVGHPIANDPCYGGKLHFGDPEARRRMEENPSLCGWKGTKRARAAAAAAETVTTATTATTTEIPGKREGAECSSQENSIMANMENAHGRNAAAVEAALHSPEDNSTPEAKLGNAHRGVTVHQGKPGSEGGSTVGENVTANRDEQDEEAFVIRTCSVCQGGERFTENQLHCVGIWLHALRYKGSDWVFETKMPAWATF